MGQNTRLEVLTQMRRRYLRAGRHYKSQRVTELVELFGYHRKAALRALRPKPVRARVPFVRGRPKEYSPDQLLPPLKAIWLAALQPCGVRLKACLPAWLADDKADHRRRATTRPGSLLRRLDSDHGGEFIHHQLVRYCRTQTPPIHFTR
jgi:hypothetical protein